MVSQDSSLIPFTVRRDLILKGTAHLKNICYHETGDYLISQATFPSYFQKDQLAAIKSQAKLDATIFSQIAKQLGITKRYIGEEPSSLVTNHYNQIMLDFLPKVGISVKKYDRLKTTRWSSYKCFFSETSFKRREPCPL